MRATARLQTLQLICNERHGGQSNRNAYYPNWQRFRELDLIWCEAMAAVGERRQVTNGASQGDRSRHLDGDRRVTQTSLRNQSSEPVAAVAAAGTDNGHRSEGSFGKRPAGWKPSPGRPARPAFAASGTTASSAAWSAAERRLWADLHVRLVNQQDLYGSVIAAIDTDLQAAATRAELRRPGSGADQLLDVLSIQGPAGRDQPGDGSGQ